MFFGFWILVIIVNLGLADYSQERLTANIILIVLYSIIQMFKFTLYFISLQNYKNIYVIEKIVRNNGKYPVIDSILDLDESDIDSTELPLIVGLSDFNLSDFEEGLEYYDYGTYNLYLSYKKGIKSKLFILKSIESLILFLLVFFSLQ